MTGPVRLDVSPPLAVVRLGDEAGRNRISPALAKGMISALEKAAADPGVRAVVLEGLPDIFCAGGTPERMLGGFEQRVDEIWEFLRSVLTCPVPVVAAVQGHALGGGLLLALYCDIQVFSARSRYATTFAMYGLAPIGGATYIVPQMLGAALGREMLHTGRSYRGQELAVRGAGVRVADHDRVVAEAHRAALYVAQGTRTSVEHGKAHLATPVLEAATEALRREAPAHEATARTAESERRIRMLYGGGPRHG
ncbi:enoyl-CoA hydratase-related protein [Actinoplanes sp. NPDC051475]|uniref:enoyl-CoA hydratase-related protein n=1 Tax=Actinoplanes sp. NPDC051475 TaxID=3157225 RepID=UPI00344C56E4